MPRRPLPSLTRRSWPVLAIVAALLLTQLPSLIAAVYTNRASVALNEAQFAPAELGDRDPVAEDVSQGDARMAAYGRAAQSVQQALRFAPDQGRPYAGLGAIYLDLGDYAAAAGAFAEAVLRDPNDRLSQFFLGQALAELGREDEARAAWTAARAGVYFAKRARDRRTSDPEAALLDARRALAIVPDNPESVLALSNVLTAQKRYTEALEAVSEVAVRLSDVSALPLEAGKLQRRLGAGDAAIIAFERAFALARPGSTDDLSARLELGRDYAGRGACYEAETWLEPMLAGPPVDSRSKAAYALVGKCHLDQASTHTALAYLEPLTAVPEPRVNDLLLMGRAYEEAGRPNDAHIVFTQVLALKPGNATAEQALDRLEDAQP